MMFKEFLLKEGKFESNLAELDRLIKAFEKLIADYPNAVTYKTSLAKLKKDRAELAASIGKK